MRGLPGSGKSTWLKRSAPTAVVCSADSWFMVGEQYVFDPTQLGRAHEACRRRFQECLESRQPLIAVDNTNLTAKDLRPYVEAALAAGAELRIVELRVPASVASARNVHGVPDKAYERLTQRMSNPLPADWYQYVEEGK